ncbi:MAG: NEW3 domain-containing protein, partial [Candidatus Aenigmatarchaeota archaeon]
MEKKTILILTFFILFFYFLNATYAAQWLSCCSSGCSYSPGQSVTINNTVYYCCSNGWQTSPCCTRSNPTVSITPSSQAGNPGEAKTYTVNVTNNDNSACGQSTFSLSVISCPVGWTCSLSSTSLTISAGSSASTTITVTSSSSAQAGTYSFTVRATNNQATSYYGQGSANYNVSQTCTRYNPTVSITPSSQAGNPGEAKTYTVTVTNNDNSACGQSTFSLSVISCPVGWTCSLSSTSLTISAGSSA